MTSSEMSRAASATGALFTSWTKSPMKSLARLPGAQTSRRVAGEMRSFSKRLPSDTSNPRHLRRSSGSAERACVTLISAARTLALNGVRRASSLPRYDPSYASGRSLREYLSSRLCRSALMTPSLSSVSCAGLR